MKGEQLTIPQNSKIGRERAGTINVAGETEFFKEGQPLLVSWQETNNRRGRGCGNYKARIKVGNPYKNKRKGRQRTDGRHRRRMRGWLEL